VALTIAEVEQEMQVPWARGCVAPNPFLRSGKPPTSDGELFFRDGRPRPWRSHPTAAGYEYPLNQ